MRKFHPLILAAVQTIQTSMPRHKIAGEVKGSHICLLRERDGSISAEVIPCDKDGDTGTEGVFSQKYLAPELRGELYLAAQLLLSAGLDEQANGMLPEGSHSGLKLIFEARERLVSIIVIG